MRIFALCINIFGVIVVTAHATSAAVRSASPDGEATIYLEGKFANDFDLAYRAILRPAVRNRSWSSLSILLVGSQIPGPGASVGVASDPLGHWNLRPFTYVVYPSLKDDYKSQAASCATGCTIELRGDAFNIDAYVNSTKVASWSRSDLYLQHPHIQLNAEVHGPGDGIYASLTPVRTTADGRTLSHPTCAFTTRGIEPEGISTLTFRGKTTNAGGTFINLLTGMRGDKC